LQSTAKYDHNAIAEGEAKLAMFKFTGSQIEALTPLMEAGNYAELLQGLTDKVGGFAEKEGGTALGKTQILKNEMDDLKEKIGGALVPVLLKVVPPLMQMLEYFNKNSATLTKVLAIVGSVIGLIWLLNAAVRAYTIVQIALNIAMSLNPVGLIIIAIVALVAGIYLLWTNSSAFRDFFIAMWGDIWGFLKGIGHWFAHDFVDFFVNAWKFVERVFSWDNIVLGFKTGINLLIRAWNALDFGIHIHVPSILGLPGFNFDINDVIPDIPYLDVGGSILQTGIAVVHRGETVVPAGRSAGGAGVARIEFGGRTDSAFATAFMKLVRSGDIVIKAA
jgi:hypothetical protein